MKKVAVIYDKYNTPINWGEWDEESQTFYQGIEGFIRPVGEDERVEITEEL